MKTNMCLEVDVINYDDVKSGQFITLENDPNIYTIVKKYTSYILIPVDTIHAKSIRMTDDNKPKITNVFSSKTGAGLLRLRKGDKSE